MKKWKVTAEKRKELLLFLFLEKLANMAEFGFDGVEFENK